MKSIKYIPSNITYPPCEREHLALLEKLFCEWHEHVEAHEEEIFDCKAEGMVWDGFFPYYFSQPVRVLFVGRESYDIPTVNYLEHHWSSYRDTKQIGARGLDASKFHSRLLCVTHGLMNDCECWEDIPDASLIGDSLGSESGISFAFMNLSKISNEGGGWESDWDLINATARLSAEKKFLERQIRILQPHVVITMSIGNHLHLLGDVASTHSDDKIEISKLRSLGHQSLLLNTYHFSAFGRVGSDSHIYQPIRQAVKKHLPLK